jgi:hypothetical protein
MVFCLKQALVLSYRQLGKQTFLRTALEIPLFMGNFYHTINLKAEKLVL